ncbi:MAG: lysophospholipid transporter LplT [Halothiobacillaceae bacterium]|nr:lysophospholipid transporter LplT [Halothiobacillaceae bacterium]
MNDAAHAGTDRPLLSRPMLALLGAQFLSAFADNALLIVAIATLKAQADAGQVPWLQIAFVAPFILLAPFVGLIADAQPKGRVLLIGNGIKLIGALGLLTGLPPVIAYGIAGIGAAVYSPAKYGILTQLFGPGKLVRANGLLEGSTIVAILVGVFVGGQLSDASLSLALNVVIGLFVFAALLNLLIPRLPIERALHTTDPAQLAREFGDNLRVLHGNHDARDSLIATGTFWGMGATLRLMLFAWVPVALGIPDNGTPANLMGAVSIGIVAGAALAGLWVTLATVNRALIGGFLLGPLVMGLALIGDIGLAVGVLVALGAAGGLFVVPMNALLQEQGHHSIGAGRALAVQNFWENAAMMGFVGLYLFLTQLGLPIQASLFLFGAFLLAAVSLVSWLRLGRRG